jgi:L-threonylcarbamoyladenylate synthase
LSSVTGSTTANANPLDYQEALIAVESRSKLAPQATPLLFPATDETIARAAALLASGNLVGIPTETVYGLAANAWDASAVRKIFAAKSRPATNPLIVHVANVERLCDAMAWPPSEIIQRQLDAICDLWPGPLTVVCPKNSRIPDEVSAGRPTVAVRIPAHEVALALLEACDFPLAAPSANQSKYISPTKAEHLFGQCGIAQSLSMVLDGGQCQWGVESTIIKLGETVPKLLRPGAVSLAELAKRFGVLPEAMLMLDEHSAPSNKSDSGQDSSEQVSSFMAPGMMREHYCPSTPLVLLSAKDSAATVPSPNHPDLRVARIAFHPLSAEVASCYAAVETLSSTGDLREVAHHLFAAMRQLDEEGFDLIQCDTCEPEGMGHAIMDRLHRAAARTQG